MWLQTCGLMDGQTDGQNNIQTDRIISGHAKNYDFPMDLAIFTKALATDGPTDLRTDRRTVRRTDIPSYRDAIAASKN